MTNTQIAVLERLGKGPATWRELDAVIGDSGWNECNTDDAIMGLLDQELIRDTGPEFVITEDGVAAWEIER